MLSINHQDRSAIICVGDVRADIEDILRPNSEFTDLASPKRYDVRDYRQSQYVAERETRCVSLMRPKGRKRLTPMAKRFLAELEERTNLSLGKLHQSISSCARINPAILASQPVVDNGSTGAILQSPARFG